MEDTTSTFTPRQKKLSLFTLCFIWFFTGVEYVVILPSAWEFLQSLGADENHHYWLSLSVSAFSIATLALSPLFGRFADSTSTKIILIISNVFELLGNVLYMCANDVYTVIEARFIAGMGAGAGAVIFAYVARVSKTPKEIGVNMGLIMTSRAVGLVLGPAFNLFLVKIDWHIGGFHINKLNSPGLLMVIIWALCQFFAVFMFYDLPKPAAGQAGRSSTAANGKQMSIQRSEYLNKGIMVLLFVQFMQLFNQTAWETFLTPFTYSRFHWDQVENSYIFMGTAVVGILVYVTITRVRAKYTIDDRTMLITGMCIQATGFIIYWAFPAHSVKDLYLFAMGGLTFVIGMPFVYTAPALQAKLTSKRTQGLGQGIRRSVVSLSQILGPLWAALSNQPHIFWSTLCLFTGLAAGAILFGYKWLAVPDAETNPAPGNEGDTSELLPLAKDGDDDDDSDLDFDDDEPLLNISEDDDDEDYGR